MKDIDQLAKEFAGNFLSRTHYMGDNYGIDKHPEYWGVYYFHHNGNAGATCLTSSNKAYIEHVLKPYIKAKNPTAIEICDHHFVVNRMDGICVKVYRNDGKTYTKAFELFAEMLLRMEQYPPLDEDDMMDRENELFWDTLHDQMDFEVNYRGNRITSGTTYSKARIKTLCQRFYKEYQGLIDTHEDCFPYEEVEQFAKKLA